MRIKQIAYSSNSILAAAAVAACALLGIIGYYLMGSLIVTAALQPDSPVGSEAGFSGVLWDAGAITTFFQQEWLVNGFLLINVLLLLILFDKIVLKPFFEKKRQALMG